jgi:hypothetical protein
MRRDALFERCALGRSQGYEGGYGYVHDAREGVAMSARKARTAAFGSISSGTMRPKDLIPTFAAELDYLRNGTNRAHRSLACAARNLKLDAEGYYKDADAANEILHDLFESLQEYAPAYAYFGASEGDGACYGFFLDAFFEQEFDGAKLSDASELDALDPNMVNEAIVVNDHGNVTLYEAWTRGRKVTWREVWGLV